MIVKAAPIIDKNIAILCLFIISKVAVQIPNAPSRENNKIKRYSVSNRGNDEYDFVNDLLNLKNSFFLGSLSTKIGNLSSS